MTIPLFSLMNLISSGNRTSEMTTCTFLFSRGMRSMLSRLMKNSGSWFLHMSPSCVNASRGRNPCWLVMFFLSPYSSSCVNPYSSLHASLMGLAKVSL